MQQRPDDSGRMLKGVGIAGCGKNHDHPDERQQPVFDKDAGFRHAAQKTFFAGPAQT
jgi:hypothetical protein